MRRLSYCQSQPCNLNLLCIILKNSSACFRHKNRCESTCCHDDSCQDFPPCMGRGKVVCELTEFIHHQAGDGISQNLKTHAGVYTRKRGHTKTKLLSDMSASSAKESVQHVKPGWTPDTEVLLKNDAVSANHESSNIPSPVWQWIPNKRAFRCPKRVKLQINSSKIKLHLNYMSFVLGQPPSLPGSLSYR